MTTLTRIRTTAERYLRDDADGDLDAEKWGEAMPPGDVVYLLAEIERLRDNERARLAPFNHGEVVVTTAATTLDHFIGQRDEACARVAALESALLRACSMLDDAVQLRDDAEKWFPEIDKLRKVALPNCTCVSTYETDRDRTGCPVHGGGK